MDVFTGLLHVAGGADGRRDVAAYRSLLDQQGGSAVGPLVVDDARLDGLGGVALSVLTRGGAGALSALSRRTDDLRVVAAETVLRDLDDLPGNAARVVAAREELPEEVDVYVGVPAGRGFVEAVEVVEAAGLLGRVDLAAARERSVAEELSVLVEADLPFKVAGTSADAFGASGVVALLMAVEALVDGAAPDEAETLLAQVDERRAAAGIRGWDEATQVRVRRRLRGVDVTAPAATLEALARSGLL